MTQITQTDIGLDENRAGFVPIVAPADTPELLQYLSVLGQEVRIVGIQATVETRAMGQGNNIQFGKVPVFLVQAFSPKFDIVPADGIVPKYDATLTTYRDDDPAKGMVFEWAFERLPEKVLA